MSPATSWLLFVAVLVVGTAGLYGLVRLTATALGGTRWMRRLDAWAEQSYGGSVSWTGTERERRAVTRRSR
jgi:hypothetical protein